MQRLALVLLLSFPLFSFAQNCDCASTYQWVKKTFEENDAGFQYIIDKKGLEAYSIHNQLYSEKVKHVTGVLECESTIRSWLSFFRQAHVEFHYIGELDPAQEDTNEESTNDHSEKIEEGSTNPLHERFLRSKKPFIERLNAKTLYIRIPSFIGNEKPAIDSLLAENRVAILKTENLIIDIRNGTGGNDSSYENLMPFIYTNPIRLPTIEFLSTPLNNQRMYELATNTGMALEWGVNPTKEEMRAFQTKLDTLNKHLGEFVNLNEDNINITKLDTVYPNPKQVGILINQNNVSTDEQFILEAKQSKKVKLFGKTTRGGLDVSNLYVTFSENKDFLLVYALSKSLRIPEMVVDDIGIMPDFYIDKEIPEHNWIQYVNDILNE